MAFTARTSTLQVVGTLAIMISIFRPPKKNKKLQGAFKMLYVALATLLKFIFTIPLANQMEND